MPTDDPGFEALAANQSLHDSAELLAHPRFDAAYHRMLESLATLWSGHPKLIRALFDYDQVIVYMVALCIDAASDPDRPETWLTLPLLSEKVGLMGVAGERRIRRIVDGYRGFGLLDAEPLPHDRRNLRFIPSERMLLVDREWIAVFHAPLAELYPEDSRYGPALSLDPHFQKAYRRVGLTTLSLAHEIVDRNEVAEFFLHQTVGIRLMSLMLTDAFKAPDTILPEGFFTSAAQRSGTSRVHVRNVVNAAAERGMIEPVPGGGHRLLPCFHEGARRWVAAALVGTDVVNAMTMAMLGRAMPEHSVAVPNKVV